MTPARSTLHRLLASSLVKAARRPIREALWRARGRGLANPRLPRDVGSILFVCKGNICRSPFAAGRARQLLERTGAGVISASAGINANSEAVVPDEACEAAAAFGLSLLDHRPVQVTRELVAMHDLTVVMEADHLRRLRAEYPEVRHRLLLLPLVDPRPAGAYERLNIPDPFGAPAETFQQCYARIDAALHQLLPAVSGNRSVTVQAWSGPRGERQ